MEGWQTTDKLPRWTSLLLPRNIVKLTCFVCWFWFNLVNNCVCGKVMASSTSANSNRAQAHVLESNHSACRQASHWFVRMTRELTTLFFPCDYRSAPLWNWQTAPSNESHLVVPQIPITGLKMPQSSSECGLWNTWTDSVWFRGEFPSRRESRAVKFPEEKAARILSMLCH